MSTSRALLRRPHPRGIRIRSSRRGLDRRSAFIVIPRHAPAAAPSRGSPVEARAGSRREAADARRVGRRDDQAGVVALVHAHHDLGIGVGAQVRPFLPRERQDDSRVAIGGRRRLVASRLAGDLDVRPFSPQIDAGRCLDDVHDVGAADAG